VPLLRPGLPKRTLFGVGVGFEPSGTSQGAIVKTILPKSPAARAGLAVGCIVTEINGQQTVGRGGDECAQIIKDCFGPVRIRILDSTLKERTLSIDKVWLTVP
jgi:C-terminal processing protease CtpA/Prc